MLLLGPGVERMTIVHPQGMPDLQKRLQGNGLLTNVIVMGTDYPYPWTSTAVEHILGTPSLSDADRAAILGDNACLLLGIAA